MPKSYQTPRLTDIRQLGEAARRELLAVLFLNTDKTDRWLYRRGLELLIYTERLCMEQNCRRQLSGGPAMLCFRAELLSLSRDLLSAANTILRERGISLSFSVTGTPTNASILPRPLQFAMTSLLIAGLKADVRTVCATVTVTHTRFRFTVTADRIPGDNADLKLDTAIAALHGGRLLHGERTAALEFCPKTKPSADPRWVSPGIDGLVNDPLSFIRLGLYSASESAGSSKSSG